jgi:hypothetical protein
MRFPSCRWPARLAASPETPSMRQPSPQNTSVETLKMKKSILRTRSDRTVRKVIDQIEAVPVVHSSQMSLRDGQTNSVSEALS